MLQIKGDDTEIPIDREKFPCLPKSFTHFRKSQYEAAEITVELLNSGVDVVALEASVGFGKSLYAEMVRIMMNTRSLYVAPKNELIDQMERSLPYVRQIRGRSNYDMGLSKTGIPVTCADCKNKSLCGEGKVCEYKVDNRNFKAAPYIGMTNTAYFLAAANHLGMFNNPKFNTLEKERQDELRNTTWLSGDHLTVHDECHLLEDKIIGFFDITVTQKYLNTVVGHSGLKGVNGKPYPIPVPPVRNFDDWVFWLIDVRELINGAINCYDEDYIDCNDIETIRWLIRLKKTKLALDMVEPDWIYDPIRATNSKGIRNGEAESVSMKPVIVGELGKKILWDHGKKTLCMSGSIVNFDIWAEETGLDKSGKSYQIIRYETNWDRWRRTIYQIPGVKMVKTNKKATWSQQDFWDKNIENVSMPLLQFPEERCLIHTVSHELSEELGKALAEIFGDRIIISKKKEDKRTYGSINGKTSEEACVMERDEALEHFLSEDGRGKVILSASLVEGTDLYDARCRNVIFARTPWGNLGDRRISAKLETTSTGNLWYLVQAVRNILQGAGRACRHKNDFCRIWMASEDFQRIVRMAGLLPQYFANTVREPGDYSARFTIKHLEDGSEIVVPKNFG